MKKIILFFTIVFALFWMNDLNASMETPVNPGGELMMEDPFLKIVEKVCVFLKKNPSQNNLSLEELLKEGVINNEEYDFIVKNKFQYNPPSTAGPHDNYLSIFDRQNEDGTSSHLLYNLVDKSDPSITKSGNISELRGYISKWFEFPSNKKRMTIFRDETLCFFSLCYWDNQYWDRQHAMLIDFPESKKESINELKKKMKSHNLGCRENFRQNTQDFTVLLPSNLSLIQEFSEEILRDIFKISQDEVIHFTPDGFRFKTEQNKD